MHTHGWVRADSASTATSWVFLLMTAQARCKVRNHCGRCEGARVLQQQAGHLLPCSLHSTHACSPDKLMLTCFQHSDQNQCSIVSTSAVICKPEHGPFLLLCSFTGNQSSLIRPTRRFDRALQSNNHLTTQPTKITLHAERSEVPQTFMYQHADMAWLPPSTEHLSAHAARHDSVEGGSERHPLRRRLGGRPGFSRRCAAAHRVRR